MNFQSFLPAGLSAEDLIVAMAAVTACVSLAAVWMALLHRDPAVRRARALAAQREALRSGMLAVRRREDRLQAMTIMRQVVERLQLMRSAQAEKISLKLARAGWRSKDAVVRYLFARIALPFAFGGGALLLLYGFDAYNLESTVKLLVSLVAVMVGAYAPDMCVKNASLKRQDKIRKSLPDALDLMVICAEAGLSLDATMRRVADELGQAGPELADEFGLTSLELGFLEDRQKALQNMVLRTDLVAMRGMINTLVQAEKYGTPLAHSLRILSAESRTERVLKAEEKAARLPAMLTVPMIIFILPPLFVVLLGPAALDIADAFKNLGF
ncbi:MAG: type II secretion system F family protein [Kiloniellales bacterium]